MREGNREVGARTIEVNRVEYVVRGTGFYRSPEDIVRSVVAVRDNVPVTVGEVARVGRGPALRRGALDVGGAEAAGGIVVVRYGENPLAAIERVKQRIAEIAPSLPERTLADGTVSKVTIVPFYDRTGLIYETLGTLNDALSQEILVTILVVLVMVLHLRSSMLMSGMLPLAVLLDDEVLAPEVAHRHTVLADGPDLDLDHLDLGGERRGILGVRSESGAQQPEQGRNRNPHGGSLLPIVGCRTDKENLSRAQ